MSGLSSPPLVSDTTRDGQSMYQEQKQFVSCMGGANQLTTHMGDVIILFRQLELTAIHFCGSMDEPHFSKLVT